MVCPKRTSGAKSDWQGRPYAVAPQERSDWQGASRIMVCPKRTRETRCFGLNLFTELINGTVFVKAGKVSMRKMKEESDE